MVLVCFSLFFAFPYKVPFLIHSQLGLGLFLLDAYLGILSSWFSCSGVFFYFRPY